MGSNTIPEITIWVTKDEWNSFLKRYDQNKNNADFFHCDVTFKKGVETITVGDAGFRMRGNTSRRRRKEIPARCILQSQTGIIAISR